MAPVGSQPSDPRRPPPVASRGNGHGSSALSQLVPTHDSIGRDRPGRDTNGRDHRQTIGTSADYPQTIYKVDGTAALGAATQMGVANGDAVPWWDVPLASWWDVLLAQAKAAGASQTAVDVALNSNDPRRELEALLSQTRTESVHVAVHSTVKKLSGQWRTRPVVNGWHKVGGLA